MKLQEIEVDLGILGRVVLKNVEQKDCYVKVHHCKILYSGYTAGLRIFVVDGGFNHYIWEDTLIIPVCNLKNYREIMFQEE